MGFADDLRKNTRTEADMAAERERELLKREMTFQTEVANFAVNVYDTLKEKCMAAAKQGQNFSKLIPKQAFTSYTEHYRKENEFLLYPPGTTSLYTEKFGRAVCEYLKGLLSNEGFTSCVVRYMPTDRKWIDMNCKYTIYQIEISVIW